MSIRLLFLVVFLYAAQLVSAQDTGFYYKYDFETFLRVKTSSPDSFMQAIMDNIKYPALARENKVEGRLDFIVVNNGSGDLEVLMKRRGLVSGLKDFKHFDSHYYLLEGEINRVLNGYAFSFLSSNSEKYLTEFSVLFKLEPESALPNNISDADFVIVGFIVKHTSHSMH